MRRCIAVLFSGLCVTAMLAARVSSVYAAAVTDPNDARSWQGATVGTFASLLFGSDTPATRQMIVDGLYLDDGLFDPSGYFSATLMATPWALGTGGVGGHYAGDARGYSLDLTGVGGFDYVADNSFDVFTAANAIDEKWFQSSSVVGETVFDLGGLAPKAAIFNTIDHDPLPQEAIESTVYLSNDLVTWTEAKLQRVWLEGFRPQLGTQWDGFVYAVGTETNDLFRFVSIVWGGPGGFIADGDNEINGVMGLNPDFEPFPEPGSIGLAIVACGAMMIGFRKRS